MDQGQLLLAVRLYGDGDRLKRAFARILYHDARHIESFRMRAKYRHDRWLNLVYGKARQSALLWV